MKKSVVHIKGTKEGLILRLDDQCTFQELIDELEKKVSEGGIDGKVEVKLHLGYRYCTEEQKKHFISIIQRTGNMLVSKIVSEVMSVEESVRKIAEHKSETYVGFVRSGQVLRASGDITILGDVNPNARVEAGGNIYVLGNLKGIAHAGINGKEDSFVFASRFMPTHVAIANQIEVMSNEQQFIKKHSDQICAYLNEAGEITYTHVQAMKKLRPSLDTVKGGS